MAGITSVCMTDLFWETLGDHRGLEHYGFLRKAVDELIVHKAQSLGPMNSRDKYFNKTKLKGTWHCALLRKTDIVLFYTVSGSTLNLAMFGTHHDYPSDGKNNSAAARTALRIANTVSSGHLPTPGWKSIRWRRPSDLIGNRELAEASVQALDALVADLYVEAETAPAYRRLMGRDIMNASYEELDAWMAEVDEASRQVAAARYAKPLSGEEHLARIVSHSRMTA